MIPEAPLRGAMVVQFGADPFDRAKGNQWRGAKCRIRKPYLQTPDYPPQPSMKRRLWASAWASKSAAPGTSDRPASRAQRAKAVSSL